MVRFHAGTQKNKITPKSEVFTLVITYSYLTAYYIVAPSGSSTLTRGLTFVSEGDIIVFKSRGVPYQT